MIWNVSKNVKRLSCRLKNSHRHFAKIVSPPKICIEKTCFFSPRDSAGVATLRIAWFRNVSRWMQQQSWVKEEIYYRGQNDSQENSLQTECLETIHVAIIAKALCIWLQNIIKIYQHTIAAKINTNDIFTKEIVWRNQFANDHKTITLQNKILSMSSANRNKPVAVRLQRASSGGIICNSYKDYPLTQNYYLQKLILKYLFSENYESHA